MLPWVDYLVILGIIALLYIRFHKTAYPERRSTRDSSPSFSKFLKISAFLLSVIDSLCILLAIIALGFEIMFIYQEYVNPPPKKDNFFEASSFSLSIPFIVLIYPILFFLPSILGLPIAITAALLWHRPGRLLILRPFHYVQGTSKLKKIIRKNIGYFGHSFTLADTTLKLPWYIRFPIFVGQIGFLQFRLRKINSDQKLNYLKKQLNNRWLRTINWCFCWSKIFIIRTNDKMWQKCIKTIIPMMDVIIIDIGYKRGNTKWELEQCLEGGAEGKLIFICQHHHEVSARKWIKEQNNTAISGIPLFVLDDDDEVEIKKFLNKIAQVLHIQKTTESTAIVSIADK